jgi:hypothetical protein
MNVSSLYVRIGSSLIGAERTPTIDLRDADHICPTIQQLYDEYGEIAYTPLANALCPASRQIQLSITHNNMTVSIDLGQISRA